MTDLKEDSNVEIVETLLMRKDSYLARDAHIVVVWLPWKAATVVKDKPGYEHTAI